MKMQPGKADEEFAWEQLNDFFQKAHNDALFEILQTLAKHVGIVQLNGLSIDEFFDRRSSEPVKTAAEGSDRFSSLLRDFFDRTCI